MLPEPTLNTYLALSAVLFSIGTAGVFLRRNLITILLSVEVMLNAVNLTFVAVDRFLGTVDGQIIAFFVMTVAMSADQGGEDRRQQREHKGLNQTDNQLHAVERQRN